MRAIVQSGPENAGKTTTIRMMNDALLSKYPEADLQHVRDNDRDIRAVLTIGGFRIGIESQGDPWKKTARLVPALALFVRLECEVIVCATRTTGGTVAAVANLEMDGYQVEWRRRTRESDPAAQVRRNRAEARWMVEQIENEMAAARV